MNIICITDCSDYLFVFMVRCCITYTSILGSTNNFTEMLVHSILADVLVLSVIFCFDSIVNKRFAAFCLELLHRFGFGSFYQLFVVRQVQGSREMQTPLLVQQRCCRNGSTYLQCRQQGVVGNFEIKILCNHGTMIFAGWGPRTYRSDMSYVLLLLLLLLLGA